MIAGFATLYAATNHAGFQSAQVWPVTCHNNVNTDAPALQSAIKSAEVHAGTVTIAAGTCALNSNLEATSAVTIDGAGAASTFLVQHIYRDIFEVRGDGVTIENVNLDTATYDTTAANPLNPNPPVIYSSASNTTVRNMTAEAGTGFGMRLIGPLPCYARRDGGATVSNVNMTNLGRAGYASVDVSCQSHAALSSLTIHGGFVSLFRDSNLTLNGEQFTPGPYDLRCSPPWTITSDPVAPSVNISIANVTSAGGDGKIYGAPVIPLSITGQVMTSTGC